MAEALLIERLEHDLDLLLEQVSIGGLVLHRRAEGLDLAGMVAASDAEHGAPPGQDIGSGEVLGEAERMPHGRDVEAAADFQRARDMGQMHRAHEDVRDALIAFMLEMVFGQPERVETDFVQLPRHRIGLGEDRRKLLIRVAALIGRSRVLSPVGQVDMARIDGGELADHANLLGSRALRPEAEGRPGTIFHTHWRAGKLADREGFEPSVRLLTYDGLAIRWFKPLTHLSRKPARLTESGPRPSTPGPDNKRRRTAFGPGRGMCYTGGLRQPRGKT